MSDFAKSENPDLHALAQALAAAAGAAAAAADAADDGKIDTQVLAFEAVRIETTVWA